MPEEGTRFQQVNPLTFLNGSRSSVLRPVWSLPTIPSLVVMYSHTLYSYHDKPAAACPRKHHGHEAIAAGI